MDGRGERHQSRPEDLRGYRPIGDYALLSDCHGSALVSGDGSVDWCCVQRFDARPVFSRLLDRRRGGYFRIHPTGDARVRRRYRPGTMILETVFETDGGTVCLTDFMVLPVEGGEEGVDGERPTVRRPRTEDRLIRIARCEGGRVELEIQFEPRFDYGVTVPHIRKEGPELVTAFGGADALVLQASCSLEIQEEGRAVGRTALEAGETAHFSLSYQLPHHLEPERIVEDEMLADLERTHDFWTRWSRLSGYRGPHREAVERSALVLRALTDVRTGAIVAAPTTSLPEEPGGSRNWDYRYTWLRDASFVMDAFFLLGYRREGDRFMEWLHRTVAGVPEALQIMYGAGGERLLPEVEIEGLEGYRRSSPVRVGNAAARQFQLDIYGEVLQASWRRLDHGGEIDDDLWLLLTSLADFAAEAWERPDSGLWEVRSEPRHFVHSKVMAWVAADRAIRIAGKRNGTTDGTEDEERVARWRRVRERIRDQVMERGVRDDGSAFRRAYELDEPDASALLFPLLGFVEPDDPLAMGTREWIEAELAEGDLIRRYRGEDGLPGTEGAFLACSFWLVENLARSGEVARAGALFERLLERRNDLGLLSEELALDDGSLLGNFPQALSHIGLINAAVTLQREREGLSDEEAPQP